MNRRQFIMAEYVGKTAELFVSSQPAVIDLIKTDDNIPDLLPLYDEALRPQLRSSQMRGWNNDPNGMTYYDGEHHLFWQSNPAGSKWANMSEQMAAVIKLRRAANPQANQSG